MAFCSVCADELKPGASFCSRCGRPTGAIQPDNETAAQLSTPRTTSSLASTHGSDPDSVYDPLTSRRITARVGSTERTFDPELTPFDPLNRNSDRTRYRMYWLDNNNKVPHKSDLAILGKLALIPVFIILIIVGFVLAYSAGRGSATPAPPAQAVSALTQPSASLVAPATMQLTEAPTAAPTSVKHYEIATKFAESAPDISAIATVIPNDTPADDMDGVHVCALSNYDTVNMQCLRDDEKLGSMAKLDQIYVVWPAGEFSVLQVQQKDGTGKWYSVSNTLAGNAGMVAGGFVGQSPDGKRYSADLLDAFSTVEADTACPWDYTLATLDGSGGLGPKTEVTQSC